jgi:hypothetical protein
LECNGQGRGSPGGLRLGNGSLLASHDGNATAYAWVVRWDDADAETAFREAVADFRSSSVRAGGRPTASRRTLHEGFTDLAWARSKATIAYRQATDETGVVLVGPDRFVDRARVSGATANVTVTVDS